MKVTEFVEMQREIADEQLDAFEEMIASDDELPKDLSVEEFEELFFQFVGSDDDEEDVQEKATVSTETIATAPASTPTTTQVLTEIPAALAAPVVVPEAPKVETMPATPAPVNEAPAVETAATPKAEGTRDLKPHEVAQLKKRKSKAAPQS